MGGRSKTPRRELYSDERGKSGRDIRKGDGSNGVTLRAGSETPMGAAKVAQNLVEAFAKKEVAG